MNIRIALEVNNENDAWMRVVKRKKLMMSKIILFFSLAF